MKLRTEMQNGCVHANGYCVDEDAVDIRQAERLVHDAAAANAYKQAIALELSMPQMMAVNAKVDELMQQWGFDTQDRPA